MRWTLAQVIVGNFIGGLLQGLMMGIGLAVLLAVVSVELIVHAPAHSAQLAAWVRDGAHFARDAIAKLPKPGTGS